MATIPSLTLDGWVNNKNQQVNLLFKYFLTSEHSQSNTFHGHITSLPYILAKHTDSISIRTEVSRALNTLYRKYYNKTELNVTVTESDDDGYLRININGSLSDSYGNYDLIKELKINQADINSYNNNIDDFYHIYVGE